MTNKKAITIDELKNISTKLIEISDFSGEEDITVKVRRPSLLTLATSGALPNKLIPIVTEVFLQKKTESDMTLDEINQLYHAVAKATLVSPSYDEIIENGLELTETQLLEIYKFVNSGVNALKSFREIRASIETAEYKQILQGIAKLNTENE